MVLLEDSHIPNQVLVDIIRVFLLGLPWKTLPVEDMIIDPLTNRVWCHWREVQSLRPMIINHLKSHERTKALAIEIEKVLEIGDNNDPILEA